MYQTIPLRTRMPQAAKASSGADVWGLYLSAADLRAAARDWPLSRFLMLARSPGTTAFLVTGWDVEDGRVDLRAEGVVGDGGGGDSFGDEEAAVTYTARADTLTHAEKAELMTTVRATYSAPRSAMDKIKQTSARALGVALLGR